MYHIIKNLLFPSLLETLYMVSVSTLISSILGLSLGVILVVTKKRGAHEIRPVNTSVSMIVDILRSVPFFILMIYMFPLTKIIAGTRIGTTAAIVPLAVSAAPFFARLSESILLEVPYGVLEAAKSMGATTFQIIFKVLIPEALSGLIRGVTTLAITITAYSTMAGAVGGGGLGDLAVRYGYMRYEPEVMHITVVVLAALVFLIQTVGTKLADYVDKRRI